MSTPDTRKSRIAYIDWMRGLACGLMFQTHCYDSWLGGEARQSRFFVYSQLGGTFPAPLFLFLAGISFALVTEKLCQKNQSPGQILRSTLRRGAEILGYGFLFRLQEYLIAWGWAPKSDLLRVDILNTIGISMMLMAILCWTVLALHPFAEKKIMEAGKAVWGQPSAVPATPRPSAADSSWRSRSILIVAAVAAALTISFLTPLLWTTWRPGLLPWPLESYLNGVHNLGTPQPYLFPIFPWSAFAFAGLAVGFVLESPWTKAREAQVFLSFGLAGAVLIEISRSLDALPRRFYPVYDYWHTSPNFFLVRVGMVMVILTACYAWCRWGRAQRQFSPLIQLGQASLLVYWVHIEFVYGRLSILAKGAQGIAGASRGLLVITVAMVALAYIRTHAKNWMQSSAPFKQLAASRRLS
jgi:uncharacterized membrane protein